MMLRGFSGALLLVCVGLMAGCDGGFSDEEAANRCDEERTARDGGQAGSCMTDDAYDQCLSAYIECGSDVDIFESCPTEFVCATSSDDPAAE